MVYIGLLLIVLLAKGNSIRLRSLIYKHILDTSLLTLRNYIKVINSILLRDK